jgi:hypothetical protein
MNKKYAAAAGAAILVMAVAGAPAPAQTATPTVEQVITLFNNGELMLDLGARQWPEGFAQGTTAVPRLCGQYLGPSERCEIPVRFTPTHAGQYSGQLRIAVNDPAQPFLTVTLTGIGF